MIEDTLKLKLELDGDVIEMMRIIAREEIAKAGKGNFGIPGAMTDEKLANAIAEREY